MKARGVVTVLLALALAVPTLAVLPATSAGAVTTGFIRGTAYDTGGSPLAGVGIEVRDEDTGEQVAGGTSGGDGTYEIEAPTGTWLVVFRFADSSYECFNGSFEGGSQAACFAPDIVVVNVLEGIPTTGINVIKDPGPPAAACEPASANTGLTNMGFESGLAGWTVGTVVDSVTTTPTDAYTAPLEGTTMGRLGTPAPGAGTSQPRGPNVLCQDFVVDQPQERFAFNTFTYDYTGFDLFEFSLSVVDPATGEVIGRYRQGAWGEDLDTSLKSSGWQGVTMDLSARLGDTLRLVFNAEGTADTFYPFWVYLDSADEGIPEAPVQVGSVSSTTASVMTDPDTGLLVIADPGPAYSDLTVAVSVTCPGGTATAATLILSGSTYPMAEGPAGTWTATIPGAALVEGPLVVQATCPTVTVAQQIGRVELYDPSGTITDLISGIPVSGATVSLYQVPGWTAADGPGPLGPTECESNLSKPAEDPWSQPAPTSLGVETNAVGGLIDPTVNPFLTNPAGRYGWDVAAGCWYVVVEADGYETVTSPVVGVPSEVTDLDLALVPDDLPAFTDVPTGHPFWVDIMWMAVGEVTTGFPDGTFRPSGGVTRMAFSAFLYRYAEELTFEKAPPACTAAPFPDVAASHPFCAEIAWMADEGLSTGFDDGTFRPDATITRQAFAAFLYRYAGAPEGDDPVCGAAPFADVPISHPFCGEIAWMADSGITGGFDDGTFRPGATITRQAMSAFLHRFWLG